MIAETTIEQIKQAAGIVEVIQDFVKLKKKGSEYAAICPFHDEKSASFMVSPAKGIYKCFGCGRSGDSIAFLMEHEKLSYLDTIRFLAKKFNIEVEEFSKREYKKPVPRLEKLSPKMIDWFENERKISNGTLLRLGLTEAKEWMPQFEKEVPVICFNYYRDGEVVNIKFRGPQKSFKLAKDAELIFYNLDAIKSEKQCVIVEGEVDCLTFHECGIYNVVSVPNGAAKGSSKLEYLDNCYSYFLNMEKVILAVDNDEPGKLLRDELARRIGHEKCWQVSYPDGCKDANATLVKFGREAVINLIETAFLWPVQGIMSMDDMYPEIEDYYENGYPKGYGVNISSFDELLTFFPGHLTVVTGIPGSGKSEYVDNLMTSLSRFHNWTWGVCSFECEPPIHVTKLAEKFTNKSFAFRRDPNHRMNRKEFEYAIAMVDKHFHFINISMVDITMDGLLKKAEELVLRKGINGLLFDPWNCIEAKYGEESETKYVLTCLNKLIAFLMRHRVHCFLVAHPTKLQKNKQTGKYNIPTLYDISGSAHFFNRSHNGMSVYRDFETNVVDIYVQKVKWSWLGKLGYCSFNYNTMTRQYIPLEGMQPEFGDGSWKPIEINYQ